METYTSRQAHAANRRRSAYLLDEWDDTQKPALERIADATLDLLHALDMARFDLMQAADVAKVDAFACDTAGQALDLLSDLIGTQQRELDDCGGREESLRLELSALKDEHKGWATRWAACRQSRGQAMNQALLYDLLQAVALLQSGRAHDGTEALVEAIREHGGVPVPQPGQQEPAPKVPLWMRTRA